MILEEFRLKISDHTLGFATCSARIFPKKEFMKNYQKFGPEIMKNYFSGECVGAT